MYTILHYTTLYSTLYYTIHYTIHYTTILHYTTLYYTLYYTIHYTTLYYTLYYTLHYYTTLYTTLYSVLHYTTLYTTLYYTILLNKNFFFQIEFRTHILPFKFVSSALGFLWCGYLLWQSEKLGWDMLPLGMLAVPNSGQGYSQDDNQLSFSCGWLIETVSSFWTELLWWRWGWFGDCLVPHGGSDGRYHLVGPRGVHR